MRRYLTVAFVFGFAWMVGCGETVKLPDTVPFSGKVLLDGKPLAGADVIFTPIKTDGFNAAGKTDETGKYELRVELGDQQKPGAALGEYKVHISTTLPPSPTDKNAEVPLLAGQMEKVAPQFSSLASTTLKATVPSGGGTKDFDLGKSADPGAGARSGGVGLPGGGLGMPPRK